MSIGQGSYFKGWASTLPNVTSLGQSGANKEVWIGHVLDIDYVNEIGKITVRLIGSTKTQNDDEIKITAYPLDSNLIKYPLPGETVLIVEGLRNLINKSMFVVSYYYMTAVTSNNSITFNSDPYIGQTVLDKQADSIYTPEYEHRFEKKLLSPESFIQNQTTVKEKSPLRPFEGDFILQGRFGSSIRFSSTTKKDSNEWSIKGGSPGNPIMIVTANRTEGQSPKVEQVNENDSTIYLCSSQTVPVVIATSAKLKSHLHRYDVKSGENVSFLGIEGDTTHFVPTPSQPWSNTMFEPGVGGNSGISLEEALSRTDDQLYPSSDPTGVSNTFTIVNRNDPSAWTIERTSPTGPRQFKIHTGGERQFRSREIRSIILHYTVSDHAAWQTVNFVGRADQEFERGGIHYAVDRWGGVAPGIPETIYCVHGNGFNQNGIGIEMSLYGAVIPLNKPITTVNGLGQGRAKTVAYNQIITENNWVDLGFFYQGYRYYQEFSDAEIQATENLINQIMVRTPGIRQAIQGQNLWKHVFGIKTGKPQAKINEPDKSLQTVEVTHYNSSDSGKYGIFAHCTAPGAEHTDTVPTPKMVAMLTRLGFVEDDAIASNIQPPIPHLY